MNGGIARVGWRTLAIFAVVLVSVSLSLGTFPLSWRGLVFLVVVGVPIVVLGEWLFDYSSNRSQPTWVRVLRFGSGIGLIVVVNILALIYRDELRAMFVV
jgi:hypothetical protein